MFFYLTLSSLLLGVAFLELANVQERQLKPIVLLAASSIFLVVAGMRYETGYDWYVYRELYANLADSRGLTDAIQIGKESGSEHGFTLFLFICSVGGLPFWSTQLATCAFNLFAFMRMNLFFKGGAIGLLYYYCWLFLVLQMALMRMSIAVSILIFAMIALLNRRHYLFLLLSLLAFFFHVYSAIISLVLILSLLNVPTRVVFLSITLALIVYIFKIDPVGLILEQAASNLPTFIADKLSIYISLSNSYHGGAGELLYKLLIVSMLLFSASRLERVKSIPRHAFTLSFFYALFLLLFWKYPIFHDRVKYFALMPLLYLVKHSISSLSTKIERVSAHVALCALSIGSLAHQTSGSLFYPYTPYFNVITHLMGAESDGEARTLRYYEEFNKEWNL